MEQMQVRIKQVDVLPMARRYMASLDLHNVLRKYVPTPSQCLVEHSESLCVLIENIICCSKPRYKVEEWVSRYSDGLTDTPVKGSAFNDDRHTTL